MERKGGERMKGKAPIIIAALVVAVMVAAGVAVAAASGGVERASGTSAEATKSRVLSGTRGGEAAGVATRNQGEESQVRVEHCLEEMNGECAGQCERSTERLQERAEDGSCPEGCPRGDEECPMYRNGAPESPGVPGNGAAFAPAGAYAAESGQRGDCDMQRDRLRTRDRDCRT